MPSHGRGRPAEDRHQLPLAGAAFGRPGRAGFAQAVRGAWAAGLPASLTNPVPEALFHPRLASAGRQIGEVTRLARSDRRGERRKDWKRDEFASLAPAMLLG